MAPRNEQLPRAGSAPSRALAALHRYRSLLLSGAALLTAYGFAAWLLVLPEIDPPPGIDFAGVAASDCRAAARRDGGDLEIWFVPLSQIPHHLVATLLRQEDRAFFAHRGVNWELLFRATRKNVAAGRYVYGAGTITMQLMRETVLGKDRTLLRKVREIAYALQAEARLSKYEILERYLNVVHWGLGVRGIGAASCHYFGVPPADLSSDDASRLVAVLPNPPAYGPRLRSQIARRSKHAGDDGRAAAVATPP